MDAAFLELFGNEFVGPPTVQQVMDGAKAILRVYKKELLSKRVAALELRQRNPNDDRYRYINAKTGDWQPSDEAKILHSPWKELKKFVFRSGWKSQAWYQTKFVQESKEEKKMIAELRAYQLKQETPDEFDSKIMTKLNDDQLEEMKGGDDTTPLSDETEVAGKTWKEWKQDAFGREFYGLKEFVSKFLSVNVALFQQDLDRKDKRLLKVLRIAQLDQHETRRKLKQIAYELEHRDEETRQEEKERVKQWNAGLKRLEEEWFTNEPLESNRFENEDLESLDEDETLTAEQKEKAIKKDAEKIRSKVGTVLEINNDAHHLLPDVKRAVVNVYEDNKLMRQFSKGVKATVEFEANNEAENTEEEEAPAESPEKAKPYQATINGSDDE